MTLRSGGRYTGSRMTSMCMGNKRPRSPLRPPCALTGSWTGGRKDVPARNPRYSRNSSGCAVDQPQGSLQEEPVDRRPGNQSAQPGDPAQVRFRDPDFRTSTGGKPIWRTERGRGRAVGGFRSFQANSPSSRHSPVGPFSQCALHGEKSRAAQCVRCLFLRFPLYSVPD
jgi:hypothetical protein